MKRRLLLALAVLVAAAAAGDALAAPAPPKTHGAQFGIVAVGTWPKGYFVLDAHPAERVHGALLVTNRGDAAGTVRLSGVDATTGRTSGAVYLDPDAARASVGRWIAVGRRLLRLAPGASVRVPFDVTVPSDATAGQHLGGLVVEPTRLATAKPNRGKAGALGIRVRQLSIVAVQVDVPGLRVERFSIGAAGASRSNGYQWVNVHLRNDGNVMTKPHGRVVVTDGSGRRVASAA